MIIYQQKEPEGSLWSKIRLVAVVIMVLVGVFFFFFSVFAVTTDKSSYNLGENGVIDNCENIDYFFNIYNLSLSGENITGSSGCDILPDSISNQFNIEDWANWQPDNYVVVESSEQSFCGESNYFDCKESVYFVSEAFFSYYEKPILTMPDNFNTDMLAYAGTLFTDFDSIILVLTGLPIGFLAIRKVISLIKFK
jgi:hypothetical protein